jgi:redox-sensing transcriptional repressor
MMATDKISPIPEPTLRRLPSYHHFLTTLLSTGAETISCSVIGRELHLDPTQVRKDLALTGAAGKPKVGYDLSDLIGSIENFLGWNDSKQAFLVGVGSLGTSLLGFRRFNRYGLEIVAAFDVAESKVGKVVHGKDVMPLEKMASLARRMHVMMGIITAPADSAQYIADQMVAGGIRGIWNFAPTSLDVPEGVIVQDEDLFSSLAVLSRRLNTAVGANA